MAYVTGYITALMAFGAIDVVWLRFMGPALYRPTLGDILLTDLRVAPALAFYVIYPVGLLVFAVLPGLKSGSAANVIGSAALFGAIAYATYDLTNFATLRNWTLQLTVLDIVYGAAASAFAAFVSFLAVRAVSNA
ncbi:DUF2177 family protein [Bradyrhizobium sp. CCGB01]|uniref:DUF2177 family protein n=1 Tax=Bradyrhizobium sp. CCGB01 TaxID=2949634 RepID=UPI0020B29CAB|nr:DUF2177 family protein [Bradyrhizobium sp. CCGB01]MCP3408858.1 DUF2177 family protein [Bradyrhizobium sp. CCGB01]